MKRALNVMITVSLLVSIAKCGQSVWQAWDSRKYIDIPDHVAIVTGPAAAATAVVQKFLDSKAATVTIKRDISPGESAALSHNGRLSVSDSAFGSAGSAYRDAATLTLTSKGGSTVKIDADLRIQEEGSALFILPKSDFIKNPGGGRFEAVTIEVVTESELSRSTSSAAFLVVAALLVAYQIPAVRTPLLLAAALLLGCLLLRSRMRSETS